MVSQKPNGRRTALILALVAVGVYAGFFVLMMPK